MTTVLADFHQGVIVTDSSIGDGDRVWSDRKVFRHKGALFAFAGHVAERTAFMVWLKTGAQGKPPPFTNSQALMMTRDGLFLYDYTKIMQPVRNGIDAIGTGAKAAMCAYEALGWDDTVKAVRIVCRHDSDSRGPVRIYRMNK